jgi:hypothetical protein
MGYDGYQHDTSGGYADEDDYDDDFDASDVDDLTWATILGLRLAQVVDLQVLVFAECFCALIRGRRVAGWRMSGR